MSEDTKIYPKSLRVKVIDGLLWTTLPQIPGRFFLSLIENYHFADINLFWKDIEENAIARVNAWYKKNQMKNTTKIVWITGASSGIGAELAKIYSHRGIKLILSSRNVRALERVKSKCYYPENIKILPVDLNDFYAAPALVKKAYNIFGRIDILINNAGVSQRSLIVDTQFDVLKKLIEINYLGTVALSRALLPFFLKQGFGHYVVVSSVMGKYGSPFRSGYSAAKHALHGFFDVMRMEHQKDNINVTIICLAL